MSKMRDLFNSSRKSTDEISEQDWLALGRQRTPPPQFNAYSRWVPMHDTQKATIEWGLVDDSDHDVVSKMKWYVQQGYARCYIPSRMSMHSMFMGASPPGHVIDHKNRIRSDNRRSNLRFATFAQNAQNRTKCPGSTSVYLGVYWMKPKWHAIYSTHHIGAFDDELHAAFTYDQYVKNLLGNDSHLNGLSEPVGYDPNYSKVQTVKPFRTLPFGVVLAGQGNYIAGYQHPFTNKHITLGRFLTSEEAGDVVNAHQMALPITRNADGAAFIRTSSSIDGFPIDCVVDDVDWHRLIRGKLFMSRGFVNSTYGYIHNQLLKSKDGCYVRHINANKLDNRRTNLSYVSFGIWKMGKWQEVPCDGWEWDNEGSRLMPPNGADTNVKGEDTNVKGEDKNQHVQQIADINPFGCYPSSMLQPIRQLPSLLPLLITMPDLKLLPSLNVLHAFVEPLHNNNDNCPDIMS